MPTGYTAKLMESGQPFEEFVLQCSRAFGALIMMRDDPLDTAVPERFEPSDYHVTAITAAKEKLAKLRAMTKAERLAFGESDKVEALARHREWMAKEVEQNTRLEEMEANVRKWTPPTGDHAELKAFMLDQIRISKHSTDYLENEIVKIGAQLPSDFYHKAVVGAEGKIAYHAKEHIKELDRANSRTEWVRQLRESLSSPTTEAKAA